MEVSKHRLPFGFLKLGVNIMKRTGTLRGIVKNADDVPLEEVSVIIVNGPSHADIAALTDVNGTFEFGSVQAGNYTIKASGSHTESDLISVRVVAKKIAFVEIWLENSSEGLVVDEI
jgi:hypothetical protein